MGEAGGKGAGPEGDPRNTPLSALLLYVLGFMGALALAAWVLARLLRRG
jgi:hypothetical protein